MRAPGQGGNNQEAQTGDAGTEASVMPAPPSIAKSLPTGRRSIGLPSDDDCVDGLIAKASDDAACDEAGNRKKQKGKP